MHYYSSLGQKDNNSQHFVPLVPIIRFTYEPLNPPIHFRDRQIHSFVACNKQNKSRYDLETSHFYLEIYNHNNLFI